MSEPEYIVPISVLFVCLGNICRSPTAQAVFQSRAKRAGLNLRIDSAGTNGWHKGERPDPRSREVGEGYGYSFEGQTSRQVCSLDYVEFDYILAMDYSNFTSLQAQAPTSEQHKIRLFLDFAPQLSLSEVPDPYYGGDQGFHDVVKLIEAASDGLIAHIQNASETPS